MKYIKAYEKINTDLFSAIKKNDIETAKYLIKNATQLGINLNSRDKNGHTALINTASYNRNEIMDELINAGVNLNIQDSTIGYTALITAAYFKNWEGVNKLIKSGADLNIKHYLTDAAPIWRLKGYKDKELKQRYDVFDYIPKKKKDEIVKKFPKEYEIYLLKLDSNKYNI